MMGWNFLEQNGTDFGPIKNVPYGGAWEMQSSTSIANLSAAEAMEVGKSGSGQGRDYQRLPNVTKDYLFPLSHLEVDGGLA